MDDLLNMTQRLRSVSPTFPAASHVAVRARCRIRRLAAGDLSSTHGPVPSTATARNPNRTSITARCSGKSTDRLHVVVRTFATHSCPSALNHRWIHAIRRAYLTRRLAHWGVATRRNRMGRVRSMPFVCITNIRRRAQVECSYHTTT